MRKCKDNIPNQLLSYFPVSTEQGRQIWWKNAQFGIKAGRPVTKKGKIGSTWGKLLQIVSNENRFKKWETWIERPSPTFLGSTSFLLSLFNGWTGKCVFPQRHCLFRAQDTTEFIPMFPIPSGLKYDLVINTTSLNAVVHCCSVLFYFLLFFFPPISIL